MLAEFPLAGPVVPEKRNPNVRELVVEPYRVIYETGRQAESIEVLRVWHSARGKPEL